MKRVISLLGLLLVIPGVHAAGIGNLLEEPVKDVSPAIVALRHQIHTHPELGNREFNTAKLVAEQLRSFGIEVRTGIAHTGVLGILHGAKPGPVVAVRADMDALPVKENSGLLFASTASAEYRGETVPVAHACGHDIHTSVQLGVAAVLAGMRESLQGTVLFIFQPAEEGAPIGEEGGAELMLKEDLFSGYEPDAIFALHSDPKLQVGEVGWLSGPVWASSDRFLIEINGKQSHGAYPQLGIDPVVTAAHAIVQLQTIVSRTLDPREPAVLTVGIVEGGARFNIIPETVHLEGTVRTYSEAVRATIERRMREILGGVTQAAGASYSMQYLTQTPPTLNDDKLAAWTQPVLEKILGEKNVLHLDPEMEAEDFAYFAREYPSFYYRLGVENPDHPSGGVHTPTFRGDDGAIPVGIEAMSGLVLQYLKSHAAD